MRTPAGPSELPTPPSFDPEAEVLALSTQTAQMVAMAQALVCSQRHVDLQGLQDQVGLLCAKALDLPPSRTGFVKLEMQRLVAAIDGLSAYLRRNAA